MIIPEREKGVKSFRIPRIAFRSLLLLGLIFLVFLGVLSYDYVKILRQVYQNKHLSLENRQLKEQIQFFQMKVESLAGDIDRIKTFEKKLRVITGLENIDKTKSLLKNMLPKGPSFDGENLEPDIPKKILNETSIKLNEGMRKSKKYIEIKNLYEQKIAANFGLQTGYRYTKDWNQLTKKSFALADTLSDIDYLFTISKEKVETLEININKLDQHLLDKDSFLRSTPTLIPTKGWITSFFGPRMSPYSHRMKMHEGLDFGARPGTPIYAPADGVVIYSGTKPGFGNTLSIDHGYGLETIYAHAKSLNVKKGEQVTRGHLVALVGNTGYSTGPHLHYEIRVNGIPVDPLYYILD